jgi:hypothetical protein
MSIKLTIMSLLAVSTFLTEQALANTIGQIVDLVKNNDELTISRDYKVFKGSEIDKCLHPGKAQASFFESIEANIEASMTGKIIYTNAPIDTGYNLQTKRYEVGFLTHPLCQVTQAEIKHSLKKDPNLTASEIKRLQDFVSLYNSARSAALNKKNNKDERLLARGQVKSYQSILSSCLAYTESLNDPDTQTSYDSFLKFKAEGAFLMSEKPLGVKVYQDRPGEFYDEIARLRKIYEAELIKPGMSDDEIAAAKNEARLKAIAQAKINVPKTWPSVGMFQFKSQGETNVGPCVAEWNNRYKNQKQCQISLGYQNLSHALVSSFQSFNSFCGVEKILQSYNTQVHTTNPAKTALANAGVSPKNRCVTPFARGGSFSYNHFGPLAYSVAKGSVSDTFPGNLNLLMECVEKSIAEL